MQALNEIGTVRSSFTTHIDPLEMQKHVSHIIINEDYVEGLEKIEEKVFLQVIYKFHLCKEHFKLLDDTYTGSTRGIFSSRGIRWRRKKSRVGAVRDSPWYR